MVTVPRSGRRGASSLGCLISLLVFVAALYYAVNIGEVYWRYYQLLDEMQVNARLAPSLTDDVIQRRLATKVADIFGPDRHMQFRITRAGRVRVFTIETQYRDSVSVPFFKHTFVLKPRAEEPI
ncbi:MAG TPA: hypothetical protein VFK09_10565 [Gemmatimonadales bacterium]|jgi:hypothetical protein|nr:hypothetical protein [Gemmatimonadales bacterium]